MKNQLKKGDCGQYRAFINGDLLKENQELRNAIQKTIRDLERRNSDGSIALDILEKAYIK